MKKKSGSAKAGPASKKQAAAAKRPQRPQVFFTLELCEQICALIVEGKTLREIERLPGMPRMGTILSWVAKHPEFEAMYTVARDSSADSFEAEAIEAARLADPSDHKAKRLLVDTLKWASACRSPKKYSTRVQNEHTGANGGPINFANMTDDELKRYIAQHSAPAAD